MKDYNETLLKKLIEAKTNYRDISLEHWLSAEFNRWNWWVSLTLTFLPLMIWWKFVDKKRLLEICVYGLLVNIIATYLDVVGSEFVWWDYPVRLFPNQPRIFPIDFSVMPVLYMLVYQYFGKWKPYLIANIIVAAVFAFIMEPLMIWMNLYKLITWKFIYSFPIYILIAIVCKIAVNIFMKAQLKCR